MVVSEPDLLDEKTGDYQPVPANRRLTKLLELLLLN